MRRVLAIALPLLLLAPLAQAADDFQLTFSQNAPASFSGYGIQATPTKQVAGQLEEWRLHTTTTHLVGTVTSNGAFDVERPRQILPEVDEHFFAEIFDPNVDEAADFARVVNFTMSGLTVTLRVAFPVSNGTALLRFTRDVTPPTFTLGSIRNLTHIGFDYQTFTGEYALANLIIHKDPDGEAIQNPTTIPSLTQTFPVRGLHANTSYTFHVEFRDWSANAVNSGDVHLRTSVTPAFAAPTITAMEPAPNSSLSSPVRMIAVNFTGPQPPSLDFVAVFVDKVPVFENRILQTGRLEVALANALGPGSHSIGVELTTTEGGKTVARWTFDVAGGSPGMPFPAILLAIVALVWIGLRKR